MLGSTPAVLLDECVDWRDLRSLIPQLLAALREHREPEVRFDQALEAALGCAPPDGSPVDPQTPVITSGTHNVLLGGARSEP